MVAAQQAGGDVVLWNLARRTRTLLTGSLGTVTVLGFTPDGSVLLSGSNSPRIIAWDLDPAQVEHADCLTLARDPGLTQAETLVPGASYSRLCTAGT